jgi:hypothetical protein
MIQGTAGNRTFEHRPISELMAIVKNDFRKFDQEGLIDEGNLIKTVMYCNDKLGIPIREVREIALEVKDYRAELPLDFEKLYYATGLKCTNTLITYDSNPWDNTFDSDVIYEASLDRGSLGCVENYSVTIKKPTKVEVHTYGSWVQLDVGQSSHPYCHIDSPNKKKRGRYTIDIKGDHIETPFRGGTLYLMYIGMMKDSEGNITFPFHPMITPYYEWTIKEKILSDAIFNSDGPNLGELFKLAQQERLKAWLDAFNFTTDRSYGEYVDAQRRKELKWYSEYFRFLQ